MKGLHSPALESHQDVEEMVRKNPFPDSPPFQEDLAPIFLGLSLKPLNCGVTQSFPSRSHYA